jgi:hypothetical protein
MLTVVKHLGAFIHRLLHSARVALHGARGARYHIGLFL